MTKSRALMLAFAVTGCATGAPAGARVSTAEGYQPFGRSAAARPVPDAAPAGSEDVRPVVAMPGSRETTVTAAAALVGKKNVVVAGKRYGDDCTGLVRGVFALVGLDLMTSGRSGDNGVTAIYRFASEHGRVYEGGRPVGGDLVFFRDTYDLNRDGRVNDGLTHVGLVERVEEDGTVIVIHRVARGVVRYRMNLEYRDKAISPEGRPVNDWLRPSAVGATPQLTAQLFAGYATVLPNESKLAGLSR